MCLQEQESLEQVMPGDNFLTLDTLVRNVIYALSTRKVAESEVIVVQGSRQTTKKQTE